MHLKKITLAIAAFLGTVLSPAIAPADRPPVADYFVDRFHDVLDVFRIRGGAPDNGKAIGLKARATTIAQVGYVVFDGTYAGMDQRGIGLVDEHRREMGVSALYASYNKMEPTWGNGYLKGGLPWHMAADRRIVRNLPHWDDGRHRYLSTGAEIATPLFAVDLGVYPEEAADLVLGLFTIDIFRDDELRAYKNKYKEATTLPDFSPEGLEALKARPFAEKQKELDALTVKLAVADLEDSEQGTAATEANATGYTTRSVDRPSITVSDTAPATNAVAPPFQPEISNKDADAAMDELDAKAKAATDANANTASTEFSTSKESAPEPAPAP